jgi:hypothetical protein
MSTADLAEHLQRPALRRVHPVPLQKDNQVFLGLQDPCMLSPQMMVVPAPATSFKRYKSLVLAEFKFMLPPDVPIVTVFPASVILLVKKERPVAGLLLRSILVGAAKITLLVPWKAIGRFKRMEFLVMVRSLPTASKVFWADPAPIVRALVAGPNGWSLLILKTVLTLLWTPKIVAPV